MTPFELLHLHEEHCLAAYRYRNGGNGHAIVYAVPRSFHLPEPTDPLVEPPAPPSALTDVMEAVTGDGGPESYLQASILRRELGEFCARGHGMQWRLHHVLGDDLWSDPPLQTVSPSQERPSGALQMWSWNGTIPRTMAPIVLTSGDGIVVTFSTYTAVDMEQILRHSDVYLPGSYVARSATETLATGGPGYRL